MAQKITSLSDIPSIAGYMMRIGAEPRSLRVAVVKEQKGKYWVDVATIKFDPRNKKVVAEPADYAPTEAEEDAIKADMDKYDWPRAKLLGRSYTLPERLQNAPPDSIFEFRDTDGMLVMLQHRSEPKDGVEKT